ncbi:MAG: glycosyltransferase [Blastochloris viridis]|uniref:Glycosyltransferase n=1 Tax=Blastochloris viridis TaxID=1079 RepID=A0A6N4QXP2_BLAVI|nr:MAG: glycosyltransferase [Blastochloris viridis]
MIKVIQMIGAAKPGGAEMFAYRFLVALNKHPEVDVLAVVRKDSWMEGLLREAGVPHKSVPFGGIFDWRTGGMVRRIAKEFQPHVVMSWMNRATRFVPKGAWATVGRLGGFYDLKYYRGKVERLVCNTEELCNYCRTNGWQADKVTMISNFIPAPAQGWKDVRDAKRRELGFAPTDVVCVMAGRLHKVKGVDLALTALAHLPENFKLLLVGEGPLREELTELAKTLGVNDRVVWAGWQDSVTPFAAASDIWLAPSRHEPLGNTCLDGWIHEVPVIVADTGGLAMLVDEGATGLKVPVEDSAALRDAILKLANDTGLQTNLVNGALAKFNREYSEDVIVGQYLAYYTKISK